MSSYPALLVFLAVALACFVTVSLASGNDQPEESVGRFFLRSDRDYRPLQVSSTFIMMEFSSGSMKRIHFCYIVNILE